MKNLLSIICALLISTTNNAQTFVSTNPENRKVILEEFTGIHCSACPGGHQQSQTLYNNNIGNVFIINVHTGSLAQPSTGEPDYRIDPVGSDLCWATVPGAGSIGYPAGTVNRHEYTFASAPAPQQGAGTFAYSQGDWPPLVTQVLSEPSPVNVGIQANADANNNLVVDIEIYYTGSQSISANKLNVAVVQNDVVENPIVQAGGTGNPLYYDASTNTYTHQHMLRHMMTGTWGEEINTISQGTLVTKQYTWQLPADINGIPLDPTKLEIVAFVSEGTKEIISGNNKLVSTAGWVAPSWDCVGGACIDPGTGNGFFGTEQQCIDNCNIAATWNCTYSGPNQGACVDPGNGTGNYNDSLACEQSCIKKSYNCVDASGNIVPIGGGNGVACVDPADESGTYLALAACQSLCGVSESYNCVNGHCEDPGDGSGTYASMINCTNSGCLPPLDVQNFENINVNIYPNPAKDILKIEGEYTKMDIYNIHGKLVLSSNKKESINVSNLKQGIYFIQIRNKEMVGVNKILITK